MQEKTEHHNSLNADAITRLRALLPSLSRAEKMIGDYILDNHQQVIQMTLAEVADQSGVSDATAVRFFRSVGYERWLDFKIALSQSVSNTAGFHEEVKPGDDVKQITYKVFQSAIDALQKTAAVVNAEEIGKALDLIEAAEKIMVAGSGTSCPVAQELFNRLFRLGLNVCIETDSYLQIMQAALLDSADLVIAISQTGESTNAIRTATIASQLGCPVITITGNRLSELAKLSDAVLLTSSHEVIQETISSRIAQHTVAHALYINLAMRSPDQSIRNENTIWNALLETFEVGREQRP